jgi:hypothetical protein
MKTLMNRLQILLKKKKSKFYKKLRRFIRNKSFKNFGNKNREHPLRPIVFKGKAKITMMTTAGKVIESISYWGLFLITALMLLGSAIIYTYQQWPGPDDTYVRYNYLDCLYFSIVTFTSLGYGDMTPLGLSRLVAGVEVFSGLFIVAILVGKVASERQNTWIQLIYTSLNQDRLNNFKKSINELIAKLRPVIDENDEKEIRKELDKILPFISGIKNYLLFQSNQGKLANFGNKSSLKGLYNSLIELQKLLIATYKNGKFSIDTNIKIENIQVIIYTIGAYMIRFHKNHNSVSLVLNKLNDNHNFFIRTYSQIQSEIGGRDYNTRRMTESLIGEVLKHLPSKPWEKNIHKQISKELNISNSLCTKCITELINRGQIT